MPDLPDSGLLVRGAPFDFDSFEGGIRRHFKRYGTYGLSVWGGTNSVAAIVLRTRAAKFDLFGPQVRVASAGDVRRAGLQLFNDHSWHHLIMFPRKPNRADWEVIDGGVFGPVRSAF